MIDRIKIHCVHPCYECHEFFGSPTVVLNHLRTVHCIEIGGRKPGQKRPVNKAFTYSKDHTSDCITHFACPSCWFHCSEDFDTFSNHVVKSHVYPMVNHGTKKSDEQSKMVEGEEEVNRKVVLEGSTSTTKSSKVRFSSVADPRQKMINEKEDEILGVLDELVNNFKMLFKKN